MNVKTFDLNLLRVFDGLLRDHSVSAVANRLGLSQPAVSNALARLRVLADDPLFVRSRAGMVPTPYAQKLAVPIQNGLGMILNGLEFTGIFDPAVSARRFALLMSDIGEVVFLPQLLGRIRAQAPFVSLGVRPLSNDGFAEALEAQQADLAIGFHAGRMPNGVLQQPLFDDHWVVIYRQGHILLDRPGRSRLSMAEYLAASHLAVVPESSTVDLVDRALAGRGVQRQIGLLVPHFTVLGGIVPVTDLAATVPHRILLSLPPSLGVRHAALPFRVPSVVVRQFWHKRQNSDPGLAWLRAHVQAIFKAGPAA